VTFVPSGGVGTVSFTPTSASGLSVNAAGKLTTTGTLSSGTHTITVNMFDTHGDTGSVTFTLTVNAVTITATPTAASVLTTGSAAYTVTFVPSGGIGTVSFTPTSANGLSVNSVGKLTTTGTLSSGTHTITVNFADAFNDTGSVTFTLTVNAAGRAAIDLHPENPTNVVVGTTVTYTANVTIASGSGTLTGTVEFFQNGVPVVGCMARPVASGVATCAMKFASAGSVTVSATYGNDPNFTGATDTSTQLVTKGTTSASISPSAPVKAPTTVNYTATVSETSGSGNLSGLVSFTRNGSAISGCQNLALSSGKATCAVTYSSGGVFTIAATYTTDVNFSSSSGSIAQTVDLKPVFTSASSTTARVGHSFSFNVTATGYPAPTFSISGHLPSGVTFNAGTGVLSGTPAHATNGIYAITISATNAGGTTTQSFTLTVTN
jgi:hypothetical protein